MKISRILFLRLLLSWWMIPLTWILVFPLGALVGGYIEAKYLCNLIARDFWSGEVR